MDELGIENIGDAFEELSRLREAMTEVASVLVDLDVFSKTWSDAAKFRRCRDRLRAAVAKGGG